MTRIFPQPFHTLLLTAVWLLLNNSMSLGHILLGLILGIVIPIVCQPLRIPQPKIAKPFKLIPYVLVVLKDVIIANIEVAILVLGPVKRIQPGFIAYPLALKDDLPITLLASTITMTPGTCSCELTEDKQFLYIHVLDMPADEQSLIDYIKVHYEGRVKEIFGC